MWGSAILRTSRERARSSACLPCKAAASKASRASGNGGRACQLRPRSLAIFLEGRANAMRCEVLRGSLQDSVAIAPPVGAQAGLVVAHNIGSHTPFQGAHRIDLYAGSFHIDQEPENVSVFDICVAGHFEPLLSRNRFTGSTYDGTFHPRSCPRHR